MPRIKFNGIIPHPTELQSRSLSIHYPSGNKYVWNLYDGSIWTQSRVIREFGMEPYDLIRDSEIRSRHNFIFFWLESGWRPSFDIESRQYDKAYLQNRCYRIDELDFTVWGQWFTRNS